jgi:hypothetical protein
MEYHTMNRMSRNGYIALGAAGAALLLGGGVAFAFWTSSGTGTGTAAAGTTGSVTVAQNGSITGLYPGGPGQTIAVDITNPNAGAVTLAGVTATVVDTSNVGCTAADFTISGPVYAGGSIAGGATVTASAATIQMVNEAARNQDACKGVTVNLAFAAN